MRTTILPGWLLGRMQKGRLRLQRPRRHAPTPDLRGDRDVEWSWVASQIPAGPGNALDFGSGGSYLGLIAAQKGFSVTAVDLEPVCWPYMHPCLRFVQGDILKLSLPQSWFDLVINCSTVEHVGLAGRYGVSEHRPDGDLDAMARLCALMKPSATMLLTIPVGRDAVIAPLHRVYGSKRLRRLLEGYVVEREQYWAKDSQNAWTVTDRSLALTVDPGERAYGLGCFVLARPGV